MAKLQVISPFEYNPSQDPANITFLQGIKGGDRPGTYLLTGSINATGPGSYGLVYEGPLDDVQRDGVSGSGTWYTIQVPQTEAFANANGTSVYGPDNLGGGLVDLVGSYSRTVSGSSATAQDPNTVGFLYTGAIDGSTTAGYRSFQAQTRGRGPATYTFVHSVDGGLAVGNGDTAAADSLTGYSLASTAFMVEMATGRQMDIRFPRSGLDFTHTAYGIWDNGDGSYTIAGGSGEVAEAGTPRLRAGSGYLIDYDSLTGRFSHYQEFNYRNRNRGDLITHFEGIYRTENGKYRLPATSVALSGEEELSIPSVVTVRRQPSNRFKARARWRDLEVVNSESGVASVLTTANSQYEHVTVGFANYPNGDGTFTQADFVARPSLL
jgi:hypothetical protein